MGFARRFLWVAVTAVWTYALGRLCSMGGLAVLGVGGLPVLPVSWSLVLAVVGMLIAFVIAFASRRFLGAPTHIWIGAIVGSAAVFVPQLLHATWASQSANELLFLDSTVGGPPDLLVTLLALVGYPVIVWGACRLAGADRSVAAA